MTCDVWPTFLQVTRVDEGSAQTYNLSAPVYEHILPNDAIVAVNGCTEPEAMLQKLQSEMPLTLQLVRPSRLVARVSKGGGSSFGLQLAIHKAASTCMWIDEIEEGAVQLHNSSVASTAQIC